MERVRKISMSPKTDPTGRLRKLFIKSRVPLFALLVCALSVAAASTSRTNRTASSLRMQTTGSFKLRYVAVKDHGLAQIEKLIKESKLFELLIDDSNKSLKLPVDITVIFRECNGKDEDGKDEDPTNAWYNPNNHSITMCYGLIKKSEDLFKNNEKTEKDLDEAVLGSTAWTFYHEMGHALIDIYKIAHTGKEEDAADELSTYILISSGDAGEKAALDGAEDFYREASEDNDLSEEQFADVHSLSKQRFYNIICWVYGSNTEKYASLTEGADAILPQGRAGACEGEYQRIAKAWQNLLASHLKK
ncbi:MAG: hypothetical protein DMF68_07015 [Acidobacteria bacterium]|nr:MAG: hypothetical protein DMF68_07015 [Acidobacteriota bacterium]